MPDRAAHGRAARPRRASAWPSTTRPCSSTSAATPTRTSRPSGSATTSRSRPTSTSTTREVCARPLTRHALPRCRARSPLHRFRLGLEFVLSGHREPRRHDRAPRGAGAAARPSSSRCRTTCSRPLVASYERWDGRGWPGHLGGRRDPDRGADRPGGRIRRGREPDGRYRPRSSSWRASCAVASSTPRSSRPADVAKRTRSSRGLDDVAVWDAVIGAEPALAVVVTGERLETALVAIANFVDLKSPYFLGHARAVAELAAEAGERSGLDDGDVRRLRHAGLLHGLGRLGISNAIWDKRGPLGAGEWERVRLQPYLTERMLRQSRALAPIARHRPAASRAPRRLRLSARARRHRDRRAKRGSSAAADAYQSMCEPRPHRAARARPRKRRPSCARRSKAGRYDADAVEAVLGAAGHRVVRRREGPAGLTVREIEVLRLVARGLRTRRSRERSVHLGEDRREPRRAHLREDRRVDPRRRRPVRDAARPPAGARVPGARVRLTLSALASASPSCSSSSRPRSCAAPRRG